jgi:hypothetical protein
MGSLRRRRRPRRVRNGHSENPHSLSRRRVSQSSCCGLDHGRPFFDFCLVVRGERLRRLVGRGHDFMPDLGNSTTAEPSLLLTCAGVPFGTHIPRLVTMCSGGPPASSIVGISGTAAERLLANMA